eukprot:jgi/Mesen1/1750/ME001390S00747
MGPRKRRSLSELDALRLHGRLQEDDEVLGESKAHADGHAHRAHRHQHAATQLLQIARLLTVKREREIEKGIKKRESQKLDREWVASIVPRAPPGYENMKEEEEQK